MKLSVVIPCRNEEKFIAECIDAIYANNLNEEVELSVVVVDGMSDDGTREIINQLALKYSNLYTVDNVAKLTPYAFNLGIKFKEADYYQIVGARQILSLNYLSTSIQKLQANQVIWCVGGAVENVYVNEVGEIIAKAMSTTFGMGLGNFRTLEESSFSDTVGTPMYPKEVFERIGYFDEDLVRNQDDDYNFRVLKAGGKIWFEHSISLKYYVRGDYYGLYRQFFQYGYWKVFVNRKHKQVTTVRQLVPPLFVAYILFFPLFFLVGSPIKDLAFLGIGIYLLLALFFSNKKAKNTSEFLGILKTFPILHFSYGLGYLLGIIHFLILGKKPTENQKRLSR